MTDEVEIKFHIKSFSLLYLFTVLCIMEHDLGTWGHIVYPLDWWQASTGHGTDSNKELAISGLTSPSYYYYFFF